MSGRTSEFQERDCDLLGISTDPVETHSRWLTTPPANGGLGPIEFPLASDQEGTVCQQYGVYVERQNVSLRGLFIIDPNGVVQYQAVHSLSVGRSSDEVLRVLDAIQCGGLCPGEREIGQATIDVVSELGPRRVIGQYEVESEIGSGSFGKVFRAHDQLLDRTVALKVFRSSEGVQSVLPEARAAAALNHPNVCAIHAVDTSSGTMIIVMEHIQGQPLSAQLASGALSPDAAAPLTRQIASGMAAAHAAGVVHGDLKPANLMVTPDNVVKIMDFGLARRVEPAQQYAETLQASATSSGGLYGTPGYMSPELVRGDPATPASDVFALGLVIYEMLTGQPAVSGSLLDVLRHIEQFDATSYVTGLPSPFADILEQALVCDAAHREITMARIAEMLT